MDLSGLIEFGASPRATIHLTLASKAFAFINGREYITPQDVKYIAMDILRHRIIISHKAISKGLTSKAIIQKILDHMEMP